MRRGEENYRSTKMSTCDKCPKVTAEAADLIITYLLQFLLKENLAIPNNYYATTTDIISSYKPETIPRLITLILNDDKKKMLRIMRNLVAFSNIAQADTSFIPNSVNI